MTEKVQAEDHDGDDEVMVSDDGTTYRAVSLDSDVVQDIIRYAEFHSDHADEEVRADAEIYHDMVGFAKDGLVSIGQTEDGRIGFWTTDLGRKVFGMESIQ